MTTPQRTPSIEPRPDFWREFYAERGLSLDENYAAMKQDKYNARMGYWENPQRIVRWYNQYKAAPDKSKYDWLDGTKLTAAYNYLKTLNGNQADYNWKRTISPDDPIRAALQSMPLPPKEYALKGEERYWQTLPQGPLTKLIEYAKTKDTTGGDNNGLTSEQAKKINWMLKRADALGIGDTIRQAYYSIKNGTAGTGTGTGGDGQKQIIDYEKMTPTQKLAYDVFVGPMSGAVQGAIGGIPGGPFGMALGAGIGTGAQYLQGTGFGDLLSKVLGVMDLPAEAFERILGMTVMDIENQTAYAKTLGGDDPLAVLNYRGKYKANSQIKSLLENYDGSNEKFKDISDALLENKELTAMPSKTSFDANWKAAHLFWDTILGLPTQSVSAETLFAEGTNDWRVDQPNVSAQLWALQTAANRIDAGESADAVYEDMQERFGIGGMFADLLGHMIADPLNFDKYAQHGLGDVASKVTGGKVDVGGTKTNPQLFAIALQKTNGPVEALRMFKQLLRR